MDLWMPGVGFALLCAAATAVIAVCLMRLCDGADVETYCGCAPVSGLPVRRSGGKVKQFFGLATPDWVWFLSGKLNRIIDLEGVIISIQEKLDADVAALVAVQVAIADEIAALKAQPAAESVDFSGLDAAVASFQSLVPAPVEVPVDVPVDVPVEPVAVGVPVEEA